LRAPVSHLTALALGVATALALGCGGRSNLIPPGDASALKDDLAGVRQAVADGECTTATEAFKRAVAVNAHLPATVDLRLRRRLLQGLTSLGEHVGTECLAAHVPTVTTDTTPTTTTTETTVTTATAETQTTATIEPTTPTTVTPTDVTPTTPTDTTPVTPPDTGGDPGDGTATP
jgi:hypothetical protein